VTLLDVSRVDTKTNLSIVVVDNMQVSPVFISTSVTIHQCYVLKQNKSNY